MRAYKGFEKDMTCRGFQYEEGKEYECEEASLCNTGFHACENPLDCFEYYNPSNSVYHEVEIEDNGERHNSDSKVVGKKIKIGIRLDIAGMVKAAIDLTMSKIKPEAKSNEPHGASSATGNCGASSATGYRCSVEANDPCAIAVAWGYKGRAKGVKGSRLVLADWEGDEEKY